MMAVLTPQRAPRRPPLLTMNARLPSLLSLAALLLAVVLPCLDAYHVTPQPTFYEEWLAAACGLAALPPLLLSRDATPWPIPRSALLPLGLAALAWLQLAFGVDALYENVAFFSLYLVWAALLMLVAGRLRATLGVDTLATALAWALLAGAALAACSGVAQRWLPDIGPAWVFRGSRGTAMLTGNLAQPNLFADYLWLGVVSAGYLLAQRRLAPLPFALVLTLLLPVSLLSGSRSVYLYAVATFVWLGLRAWRESADRRRLLAAAALIGGILALAHPLLALLGTEVASTQRIASQGTYDHIRTTLWRAALDIAAQHPLLGAGIGSFPREYFARIASFPINGTGIPEHAHNIFMQLLAELGAAGEILFVAAVAAWFLGRRGQTNPAAWLALGLLAVIGIHSCLEYPLWYAHFLGIAAIAVTLGEGRLWSWYPAGRHRLLLAAAIAGTAWMLIDLRQDYATLEALFQARDAEGRVIRGETADAQLVELYEHSLWRNYTISEYAERITIDRADLATRLAVVREATHYYPIRGAVFTEAALLQLDGQTGAAREQLRRAMLSFPADIDKAAAQFSANRALRPQLQPLIDELRQRSF